MVLKEGTSVQHFSVTKEEREVLSKASKKLHVSNADFCRMIIMQHAEQMLREEESR